MVPSRSYARLVFGLGMRDLIAVVDGLSLGALGDGVGLFGRRESRS